MAGVQVVVRKLITFQGREEEFSNVYYFGNGGLGDTGTTEAEAAEIFNACRTRERPVHANNVRFLGGNVRELGLLNKPKSGDALYVQEQPPGEMGTFGAPDPSMYYECAVMVRFLLGGRRFLRTMLHTCTPHGYNTTGSSSTSPTNLSAALKTWADAQLVQLANGYRRTNPGGDVPSAVGYAPYLEHRQFHEGRRRKAGILG